jgi:hypothetical protein
MQGLDNSNRVTGRRLLSRPGEMRLKEKVDLLSSMLRETGGLRMNRISTRYGNVGKAMKRLRRKLRAEALKKT